MVGANTSAPTMDSRVRIFDFFIDAPKVLNNRSLGWSTA
jgi:hypothetical protein